MKDFQAKIKAASEDCLNGAVFLTEGLLVSTLLNPQSPDAKACIRAELSAISGGRVPEDKVNASLLEQARALIG